MKSIDRLEVVFVDDDDDILHGIERNIRSLRLGWKLGFFANAYDAMDYIKENGKHMDVLVCDNDMPYVKGYKILDAVSSSFPDILRVTLSGILNAKTIVGTSKHAELIICKPISIAILCEKIVAAYIKKHEDGDRPNQSVT